MSEEEYPNTYKKWSESDIANLKKYYLDLSTSKLSKILGRSPNAIRKKARRLEISDEREEENREWTEEEDQQLKEEYKKVKPKESGELTISDIAEKHDRTKGGIRNRAYEKSFNKTQQWDQEQIERVKEFYKNNDKLGDLDLSSLSKELGRSRSGICTKAEELDLTDKNRIGSTTGVNKKTYQCAHCDKEVKRYPSQVENNEKIYCSLSCAAADKVQNNNSVYSSAKGGKRKNLDDIYFRSAWEANYARYLNFVDIKWEYEPKEFEFEEIKRGTRFYTPDFYLPGGDRWIEIKGYFDDKSQTKIKRFKKYHKSAFDKLTMVIRSLTHKNAHLARDMDVPNLESYEKIRDNFGPMCDNWE